MDPRKFPLEILQMILRYLLDIDHPIKLSEFLFYRQNLGIIQTCCQLRDEARVIFYGHNTFEADSTSINNIESIYNSWYPPPPLQYLQCLNLYISDVTDIPKLLQFIGNCKGLRRLGIIIEEWSYNTEFLASLEYNKPSKLDLIGVEILQSRAHQQHLEIARVELLKVL